MFKTTLAVAAALALMTSATAFAALKVGDTAPDFQLPSALNGHVSTFSLKAALKKGPVVVYFYPKAFTGGCSMEAHDFSEAMPKFKAKHVSVIGVSADGIDILKKFSKQTCAGKFPVAADPDQIAGIQYDAAMDTVVMDNRISYVVGKDGKIAYVHEDGDASTHVPALLEAVGAGS